jgi:Spy/CpxP family protein refolding chaperone
MKSKLILAAGLVSLAAALVPAANAAQSGGAAQAGGGQAKPHSHMQEKTGITPRVPSKAAPRTDAVKLAHDHGKFHK